ncbi:hypothetical protein SAMN04488135_10283 [Pollutimonas bauzanensis]|uniref:Uncharacterized protein n=1 Tax=Pollutimonas bauzanensis TaxID=658167 RepID=A0A1M5PWW5_9BURK|nr:hypothetical protein SAMN04488135_10283 [Pollutimonas bauzanensis]
MGNVNTPPNNTHAAGRETGACARRAAAEWRSARVAAGAFFHLQ